MWGVHKCVSRLFVRIPFGLISFGIFLALLLCCDESYLVVRFASYLWSSFYCYIVVLVLSNNPFAMFPFRSVRSFDHLANTP
jgi:hypothetical protein